MNPPAGSEDLRQKIREAGLRATPARIAALAMLLDSPAPLSHAEVAEHLIKKGVDKATAFRNLNDMTDAGLLRRTELGDHVWRFEPIRVSDHDASTHPHFLCVDCGKVTCLSGIRLTSNSMKISHDIGEVTEILFRGHCKSCR